MFVWDIKHPVATLVTILNGRKTFYSNELKIIHNQRFNLFRISHPQLMLKNVCDFTVIEFTDIDNLIEWLLKLEKVKLIITIENDFKDDFTQQVVRTLGMRFNATIVNKKHLDDCLIDCKLTPNVTEDIIVPSGWDTSNKILILNDKFDFSKYYTTPLEELLSEKVVNVKEELDLNLVKNFLKNLGKSDVKKAPQETDQNKVLQSFFQNLLKKKK